MWARILAWLSPRKPLSLGEQGERVAARYLRRLGYQIVSRRQRDRMGEIDLVAVDRGMIVFVEVKTRRSLAAGHPAEAVDDEKQRRISRTAWAFLKQHHLIGYPTRFDVVAVTWPGSSRQPLVEHFPDAFEAALDDA